MEPKDLIDMVKKMKERKKTVSITIDETLYEDLMKFQKNYKIKKLSPVINEVLKEWMAQTKEEEDKE